MSEREGTAFAYLLLVAALAVWIGAILCAAGWWGLRGAGVAVGAGPVLAVLAARQHLRRKYREGGK